MSPAACLHENRAEWGAYALCFDCGAERGAASLPVPVVELAPSIPAQRLATVSARAFGKPVEAEASGIPCATCGGLFGSLHGLIAHVHSEHATTPAGAA